MKRIVELETLHQVLQRPSLEGCVVQGLDLTGLEVDWLARGGGGAVFLGCRLSTEWQLRLLEAGAVLLPRLAGLPYDPYRSSLYTWQELLQGWTLAGEPGLDRRIYDHFVARRKLDCDLIEALAQRLHDHAIDDALHDLLERGQRVVGVMGGHGVRRDQPNYLQAARMGRLLAREGYFVLTGGGPGIMEAANLGAYLSARTGSELEAAVTLLGAAPDPSSPGYVAAALGVLEQFPTGSPNLAVPTWFYGNEPTNVFASHIAKYFSNGLREETLLAVSLHGVIFCPGGAGTTQEIFQDAAQNQYGSYGRVSPMVFLDRRRYQEDTTIYPTLQRLAEGKEYSKLLFLTDEPEEALEFLRSHPPVPVGE